MISCFNVFYIRLKIFMPMFVSMTRQKWLVCNKGRWCQLSTARGQLHTAAEAVVMSRCWVYKRHQHLGRSAHLVNSKKQSSVPMANKQKFKLVYIRVVTQVSCSQHIYSMQLSHMLAAFLQNAD